MAAESAAALTEAAAAAMVAARAVAEVQVAVRKAEAMTVAAA